MKDDDFFDLCYEEYKRSHDAVEDMYRRYPFAFAATVVLGGALYTISRDGLWQHFFVRVDVTAFYLALVVGFASLVSAAVMLTASIWPKKYSSLKSVETFGAWIQEYAEKLKDQKFPDEAAKVAIEQQRQKAFTERICAAVTQNLKSHGWRLRFFNWWIYCFTGSLFCLGAALLFGWLLNTRGV